MHSDEDSLSPEQQVLMAKYYTFYRDLDEGRRPPATKAQWHFLAVCRGIAKPRTDHEYAYLRMKALQAKVRQNLPLARLQRKQIPDGPAKIDEHFCPCCARQGIRSLMVWRTARDPSRSGYFQGCSRFPECRYIEHG